MEWYFKVYFDLLYVYCDQIKGKKKFRGIINQNNIKIITKYKCLPLAALNIFETKLCKVIISI